MRNRAVWPLFLFTVVTGCASSKGIPSRGELIAKSAGWTLWHENGPDGIAISPGGIRTTVPMPGTPGVQPSYIWQICGPRTGELFLVLYAPPVASGAAGLWIYRQEQGRLTPYSKMLQHFEFGAVPGTEMDQAVVLVDHGTFKLSRLVFAEKSDVEMQSILATWVEQNVTWNQP